MTGMQVGDRNIRGKKQINALALIDKLLAIPRELNNPSLVQFLCRLKDIPNVLGVDLLGAECCRHGQ